MNINDIVKAQLQVQGGLLGLVVVVVLVIVAQSI